MDGALVNHGRETYLTKVYHSLASQTFNGERQNLWETGSNIALSLFVNASCFCLQLTTGALRVWSLPQAHCVHSQSVQVHKDETGSSMGEILHAACYENVGKVADDV